MIPVLVRFERVESSASPAPLERASSTLPARNDKNIAVMADEIASHAAFRGPLAPPDERLVVIENCHESR
jgi:hypothetical protein